MSVRVTHKGHKGHRGYLILCVLCGLCVECVLLFQAADVAAQAPGAAAASCGIPAELPAAGRGQQTTFPAGQYPVTLPAVSLLGARNDLPNPYEAGADWGHLPSGRTWGSTASVSVAPDDT